MILLVHFLHLQFLLLQLVLVCILNLSLFQLGTALLWRLGRKKKPQQPVPQPTHENQPPAEHW